MRKNALIYGLHKFGVVSGPLLTKYFILVHFAGQKAGFQAQYLSILILLHGGSVKMSQQCAEMH